MNEEPPTKVAETAADIGATLRKARKAQGLTQQDFADLAMLGVRFVSELERGKETAEIGLVLRALHNAGLEIVLRPRDWNRGERDEEPQT